MSGPDVTPKTESGRALWWEDNRLAMTHDEYGARILAIEQEAASKAVAEVLDRLEDGLTKALPNSVTRAAVRALIASERKP